MAQILQSCRIDPKLDNTELFQDPLSFQKNLANMRPRPGIENIKKNSKKLNYKETLKMYGENVDNTLGVTIKTCHTVKGSTYSPLGNTVG